MTAIAAEFPDVPHRYCENHFLRDVAKPVLEADSHAKVQMRRKVRGLRSIERTVLKHQRNRRQGSARRANRMRPWHSIPIPTPAAPETDTAGAVVLDYCAAVRGILNDDQGGPLQPPGLRMADALQEVRASIQRDLDEQKGDSRNGNSDGWPAASTADWTGSGVSTRRSGATSGTSGDRRDARPGSGTDAARRGTFTALIDRFERDEEDPVRGQMVKVMIGFLAGLFVGESTFASLRDNSIWSGGFACPRATSVGFTGTAMRGFASFTTDRRCCRPWMPT